MKSKTSRVSGFPALGLAAVAFSLPSFLHASGENGHPGNVIGYCDTTFTAANRGNVRCNLGERFASDRESLAALSGGIAAQADRAGIAAKLSRWRVFIHALNSVPWNDQLKAFPYVFSVDSSGLYGADQISFPFEVAARLGRFGIRYERGRRDFDPGFSGSVSVRAPTGGTVYMPQGVVREEAYQRILLSYTPLIFRVAGKTSNDVDLMISVHIFGGRAFGRDRKHYAYYGWPGGNALDVASIGDFHLPDENLPLESQRTNLGGVRADLSMPVSFGIPVFLKMGAVAFTETHRNSRWAMTWGLYFPGFRPGGPLIARPNPESDR